MHGIISSTVPPDPPSNVMVTATETELSLRWTNSFDGHSPITMVMITYKLAGSTPTTVNVTTITSYTIMGLSPNMEYTISLQSFNAIGGSGVVNTTGMTRPLGKLPYMTGTSLFTLNRTQLATL